MIQVLHEVTSLDMLSVLDYFSGWNQIEFCEDDQYKMMFTTPWETFSYRKMPFNLINVGEKFQ